MGRLIAKCPKCGKKSEVKNTIYMKGDGGTSVVCHRKKCSTRFYLTLSDKDVEELYGEGHEATPIVNGAENYEIKATFLRR